DGSPLTLLGFVGPKKCSKNPAGEEIMAKMFMSLGFWMTIVLFIALGYAFDRAWGAECAGSVNSINCGYTHATRGSSISPVSWNSPDENQNFQIENGASNDLRRRRCANNAS